MYKILNTKTDGELLTTEVEYTLKNGEVIECSVNHFQPKDKEEVIANIENRELTEQVKFTAMEKNSIIEVELKPILGKATANRLSITAIEEPMEEITK